MGAPEMQVISKNSVDEICADESLKIHGQSLSNREIRQLSSEYLNVGAFQDSFEVKSAVVSSQYIDATVRMSSFGISLTDAGGYHLTAPTVFRMVGQLIVIHGHWLLGLEKKSIEVWVKDHYMKHRKPVRNFENIDIKIKVANPVQARGMSTMYGLEYEISIGAKAVIGNASAFFDTSPLSETERQRLLSHFTSDEKYVYQ
jgi:hypothetical protein